MELETESWTIATPILMSLLDFNISMISLCTTVVFVPWSWQTLRLHLAPQTRLHPAWNSHHGPWSWSWLKISALPKILFFFAQSWWHLVSHVNEDFGFAKNIIVSLNHDGIWFSHRVSQGHNFSSCLSSSLAGTQIFRHAFLVIYKLSWFFRAWFQHYVVTLYPAFIALRPRFEVLFQSRAYKFLKDSSSPIYDQVI